jgi:hypothetical protein
MRKSLLDLRVMGQGIGASLIPRSLTVSFRQACKK